MPITVMTIFGTRPEAIKMAPIILKMKRQPNIFKPIIVVTGQHHKMLYQVLNIFHIKPNYNLHVMQPNQTLSQITTLVLNRLDKLLDKIHPDIILVHGDTTTTFASAVSAFYHQIKLGHVEAGLRTWNKYSPYPEEMNRRLVDDLADLYFAPTKLSRYNLLLEHHNPRHIFITGNTAIDALHETVKPNYHHQILDKINPKHKIILLTMHRRENQGQPMIRTFKTIKKVLKKHPDVDVIYPVHLNPNVKRVADKEFKGCSRVHLLPPLNIIDFHNLMNQSYFVMTDSGGIQEEAPSLNKPVLVLRNKTERPEGIKAGTLKVIGTKPDSVKNNMEKLLTNRREYQKMSQAKNPYGDGKASNRILKVIQSYFASQLLLTGA